MIRLVVRQDNICLNDRMAYMRALCLFGHTPEEDFMAVATEDDALKVK